MIINPNIKKKKNNKNYKEQRDTKKIKCSNKKRIMNSSKNGAGGIQAQTHVRNKHSLNMSDAMAY